MRFKVRFKERNSFPFKGVQMNGVDLLGRMQREWCAKPYPCAPEGSCPPPFLTALSSLSAVFCPACVPVQPRFEETTGECPSVRSQWTEAIGSGGWRNSSTVALMSGSR